jgi:hypothetical protein
VLHTEVIVAHPGAVRVGRLQHRNHLPPQRGNHPAALHGGTPLQFALKPLTQRLGRNPQRFQQGPGDPLGLIQKRVQHVLVVYFRVAAFAGQILGGLQRSLKFFCESIRSHTSLLMHKACQQLFL